MKSIYIKAKPHAFFTNTTLDNHFGYSISLTILVSLSVVTWDLIILFFSLEKFLFIYWIGLTLGSIFTLCVRISGSIPSYRRVFIQIYQCLISKILTSIPLLGFLGCHLFLKRDPLHLHFLPWWSLSPWNWRSQLDIFFLEWYPDGLIFHFIFS